MFYYNNILLFPELISHEDIGLKEYKKIEHRWYRKWHIKETLEKSRVRM